MLDAGSRERGNPACSPHAGEATRPNTVEKLKRNLLAVHGGTEVDAENVDTNRSTETGSKAKRGLSLHAAHQPASHTPDTPQPPTLRAIGQYDIGSPGLGLSSEMMKVVKARVRGGGGTGQRVPARFECFGTQATRCYWQQGRESYREPIRGIRFELANAMACPYC